MLGDDGQLNVSRFRKHLAEFSRLGLPTHRPRDLVGLDNFLLLSLVVNGNPPGLVLQLTFRCFEHRSVRINDNTCVFSRRSVAFRGTFPTIR